jgi:hypothetical protein
MTPYSLRYRSIYITLRGYGLRCYWEGVIRKTIAQEAKGRCQICGVSRDGIYQRVSHFEERLPWASCHEIWQYDKKNKKATVVDLKLICRRCNLSVHIGIAASEFLGNIKMDAWNEIIAHIARVNEISISDADSLVNKVLSRDDDIDEIEWTPVISTRLQKKFPALQLIDL